MTKERTSLDGNARRPVTWSRVTKLAMAILTTLMVAVLIGAAQPTARTASTSNLRIIHVRDDAFWNYDFRSKNASSDNVDWPVDFVFYNNAEIDKVKRAIDWHAVGGTMYGRLDDGSGFAWDSDRGGKSTYYCYGTTANHFREYADSDDRMYNLSYGYWTYATVHQDRNECGGGEKWSGNSEYAEHLLANRARSAWGSANVSEDRTNFYNREPARFVGDHYWNNDGYATFARVP